jgi:alpha-tubulin suppressor-like RCC1 family protein
VGALTNWKQVSVSENGVYAIKTDGTLWAWGNGSTNYGLGNGYNTTYSSPIQIGSLTNWKQVSRFNSMFLAVKTDGTLWYCGRTGATGVNSPVQIGSLTTWKSTPVNSGATQTGNNYSVQAGIADGYI